MDKVKEASRYRCISRVDKKTVTGKTDYKDRYLYRILDTNSGKVAMLNGAVLKVQMQKGIKIGGLELTADNRIMLKDLKADRTVITPSAVKVGKVDKNNNQCVDFSLAVHSLCQQYCTRDTADGLKNLMGADTLRVQNCGYGLIESTAKKAKMLGGMVHTFKNQKIVLIKNGKTVTMLAEKWVYSNTMPVSKYDFREITTFGAFASLLNVKNLEINGIEFLTNSLHHAFAKTYYGWGNKVRPLENIRIINSDMSYIENLDCLCDGIRLHKIEISGTNLNRVTSMSGAFREGLYGHLPSEDEPMVIDIPDTPNLIDVTSMFESYCRNKQPDMKFMECAKIKEANSMFQYSTLSNIDLSMLNLSELVESCSMFSGCTKLKQVNFGKQMITKLKLANYMFEGCESIDVLNLMCIDSPGLKRSDRDCLPCSRVERTSQMFCGINRDATVVMSRKMLNILNENLGRKS